MSIKLMTEVWQLELPHYEQSILLILAAHAFRTLADRLKVTR